jgi:hypothetical protein
LANFLIPAISFLSLSDCNILFKIASAVLGFLWRKLSSSFLIKSPIKDLIDVEFESGEIVVDPSLVLVCDSNTGSCTLMAMAPTILARISDGSNSFLKNSLHVFTSASRNDDR